MLRIFIHFLAVFNYWLVPWGKFRNVVDNNIMQVKITFSNSCFGTVNRKHATATFRVKESTCSSIQRMLWEVATQTKKFSSLESLYFSAGCFPDITLKLFICDDLKAPVDILNALFCMGMRLFRRYSSAYPYAS